jgi:hypothetical protein
VDYAQARIQARFGERPDESTWQVLANARGPNALLEVARSCGLRRWIAGLDASCGSHAIEISMRARWRECVLELASWMPAEWRPATLWLSGLVDLPALCHLARGEALLPWMRQDPVLRPYCIADPGERQTRLRQDALAFIESQRESQPVVADNVDAAGEDFESQLRRAWYEHWRRLWPARRETGPVDRLVVLVEASTREPASTGQQALRRRLRTLFRELTLRPAAAFVFLALIAIDIARLRAELLKHALLRESGLAA